MAGITLYGLKNCDSCKKARLWLEEHHISYTFHDVRADGITRALIASWLESHDWETLLNRRSTTWRQLDDDIKEPMDTGRALKLMLEYPTLVKRPVLQHSTNITVGFSPARYEVAIAGTQ